MMSVREPILKPVAIADLRPTQMTVGVREVKEKRKRWRDESNKKGAEFLGKQQPTSRATGCMSRAHSWVRFSQWGQHGCSAVPAAAAQAQVRHKEAFSPKSSARRRSEAQAQS